MCPMAPRPSSSGISRSMSTTSGACARTFRSASMPSRAVATTRNSPDPSTSSVSSRRKNGLSSTTSTRLGSELLDTTRHCDHLDHPVTHAQSDGAAEITAHCFSHERDAVLAEHLPGCNQIPLTHLYGAWGRERREHTGAPSESGGDPARLGPVGHHQLEKARHRRLGELGRIR